VIAALGLAFGLAGCAEKGPVVLSSQYTAPEDLSLATGGKAVAGQRACRLHLGEIRDMRGDPKSMGQIGDRLVHAEDSAAWVRSGLYSLARDPRLSVDGIGVNTFDLTLNVDLLKAYVLTMPETRANTVVLRIHYNQPGGATEEQIYRGSKTGLYWNGGNEETQGGLNRAFAMLLEPIHRDVLRQCALVTSSAAVPAPAPAPAVH
jgi:hypothetical protein